MDLEQNYPDVETVWQPVEAHPRPEHMWMYSDIASEGLFYIKERGLNENEYIRLVYEAHYKNGRRIDAINVLADIAEAAGVDKKDFLAALKDRRYKKMILDNNDLVWERLQFDAVPDYVTEKDGLYSIEDHMISKEKLRSFLSGTVKSVNEDMK